jgi:zinc transporter ZupT
MEHHFWTALAASMLAAGVTTAGIVVIRRFESWGRNNTAYFVSFAAGILITVSLLHIIPKALEMQPQAAVLVLAGYMALYASNRFITTFVCDRPERAHYAIGLVPMIGIGLHSFIDGAIYSVTFTVGIFTGALTAVGMVLHEFPEGVVTYVLLLRAGFGATRAFALAFLAAALTTPVGMLASFPFVDALAPPVLGALLALSGGALLYVGATHLLPQAEREARRFSVAALVAGMIVALGIVLSHG